MVGTCPVSFFWRTGPRKPKKPSQHTLVMLGLQRDRVPDAKAWGMTSDDVCLARMSVHTQHQMVPKFRQHNVPVIVSPDKTAAASLLAAALALFCESDASRRNFFAGGGATGSGSADVDVASVAGVLLMEMRNLQR